MGMDWIMEHWWQNANKVYDYVAANHDQFMGAVSAESDRIAPLLSFCGGDDGVVTDAELTACGKNIADYVGMTEGSQNYLYDFARRHWNVIDMDSNGELNVHEFQMAIGGLAATNALTVLEAFDTDQNGALTGAEIEAYYQQAVNMAQSWGYTVSDDKWAKIKAKYEAKMADGKLSMIDIALFELDCANVFLA